ncbi:hypothetical protein V8C86DRAFT_2794498, partial [Haematococcus lacustris]
MACQLSCWLGWLRWCMAWLPASSSLRPQPQPPGGVRRRRRRGWKWGCRRGQQQQGMRQAGRGWRLGCWMCWPQPWHQAATSWSCK